MRRLAPLTAVVLLACDDGADVTTPAPDPVACAEAPGEDVPLEEWRHVTLGEPVVYASNPPASGPHWPVWADYVVHDVAVPREQWVHNLEHGAIVYLHRPDASDAEREALLAAYDALPPDPACGHRRALLTPDPALEAETALVAAGRVLLGPSSAEERAAFAEACRNLAPEDVCAAPR